jgi:hypothetical protein
MSGPVEHVINRLNWAPGPWDEEPDRLEWRTGVGYPGLIVRGQLGALCGYAGLPPGHPCHGIGYEDVPSIEVHGGLTYGDACQGPVCHVPSPGEPDDVWWLGFDCAHYLDCVPGMTPMYMRSDRGLVYRDVEYVRNEVEALARQLWERRG